MKSILYAELTNADIEKAIVDGYMVIVPMGCVENHGPHLPVDMDNYILSTVLPRALKIANRDHGVKGLLLPVVPFGQASEHMQFAGTISLMAKTHLALLSDILDSLIEHGFKKILVIQGCGGHFLHSAAFEAKKRALDSGKRVNIYVESSNYYEIGKKHFGEDIQDFHAGEFETSLCLAARPELVSKKLIPVVKKKRFVWESAWMMKEISETGVTGNPEKASAKIGKQIWDDLVAHWVARLRYFFEGTGGSQTSR